MGLWHVLGFDPFARAMAAPVRVPKSRVGAPSAIVLAHQAALIVHRHSIFRSRATAALAGFFIFSQSIDLPDL